MTDGPGDGADARPNVEPGAGEARRADRGRRGSSGWRRNPGSAWSFDADPGSDARPPWGSGPPPWGSGPPPWGSGPPPWAWRRRRATFRRFGCLLALLAVLASIVLVAVARLALGALGALIAALGGRPGPAAGTDLLSAASLVVLVGAVGALVVVARTASSGRPISDLVDALRGVEAGDYSVRVAEPARGPHSLRDLVRGFNTMATRLGADEEQRRSLLADVSHELRTPIAVVQGNLEAIIDGVYPADRAHLEPLLDETRVLTRLVEDLRTLALAEAGTLTLHREPTDLGLIVEDVATSFAPRAAEAGVALSARVGELPPVDVDPIRVREVLANLVANALRHTPAEGRVTVEAERSGDDAVVRVADTGEGIPPDLLPHVFERFARGPASRGSGLGLAIARGLVEAHGGAIGVASRVGEGTEITLRLPLGAASA